VTQELGDVIEARLRLLIELEKAIRAMRDVLEPATRGAPLESERRLSAAPRVLEDLDSLASQVTDMRSWRLVRDELELRSSQARMEFGQSLESALTDARIPWTGSFPTYRIWNSIRLDVNPSEGTVRAGRRTIPIGSAAEIARALLKGRKTTTAAAERPKRDQLELGTVGVPLPPAPSSRPSVISDFDQELGVAYASAASSANVSHGDYVSIGKLYDALKPRMPRGYTRARFARDLGDLANRDQRIEFASSRHPRHGMRVPPGGNLVGSVRVRAL
jgi:hypothetical protein